MELPFVKRKDYEEVVYKLECLLCHATGGKLSKHTYPLKVMEVAVTDYIQDCCEEALADNEGKWEVCSDEYEICASEFVCSICKASLVSSELTDEEFLQMMKYCPNCGAKMDGERKEK